MRSQDTITLSRSTDVHTPAGNVTIPRELGPVRLLREIGRGGMGVVYLGRHQMLDRDVAVKFLLNAVAGSGDPGFARFLEGARAAARLEHPGLTAIHHADVVDGIPYLVMQYIDGPALSDVLKQTGPLSRPALFAVLDAVSQAIGALHDREIVHRDIKPSNMLLDWEGQVFVTDFGLACSRPLGQRGEPSAGLAGTPAYMAPEMFEETISPRSDVYALGITAFELLTGELPFTGTLEELRQQHLHEPLPLDPLRRRQVDPAIIEVLERAAHKNAMFRYKTAEHFGKALKAGITTDELLREGVAELQKLGTRSLDKESDVAATEATGHTPTSSYFDRLSEIADEKRAARELPDKEDAPKPTQDDRAEAPPLSPDDEPVGPGPIPGPPSAEPARAATLVVDVPCAKCDYNLRGLPAEGRCPECGEAVASSLNPDRLMFADRVWVTRIARGLTLIYIAIPVTPLIVLFAGIVAAFRGVEILIATFFLGLFAVVVGIFFSTVAEPRRSRDQLKGSTRRIVRGLAVLLVLALLVNAAFELTTWHGLTFVDSDAWDLVPVVLLCLLVITFLLRLPRLVDRIPDLRLSRQLRRVSILLGALACVGVGALVGASYFFEIELRDPAVPWVFTVVVMIFHAGVCPLTLLWAWILLGRSRRGIKRAVAIAVSYETLIGDVPTEVALPTSENDRAARRSPRAETGDTGGASTDVDEVPSSGDIPCIHCGYNLRGLPEGGRCPECGAAIALSFRGNLLSAADPAWLQRVCRGQGLVWAGCVALVTHFILYNVFSSGGSPGSWVVVHALGASSVVDAVLEAVLSAAVALLLLLGVFTTTTLDPRLSLTEQPIALRRFVRLSIVALVALAGSSYLVPTVVKQLGADVEMASLCRSAVSYASLGVFLCGLVGICYYLATLATRIPDPRLAARTRPKVVRYVVCVGILLPTSLVFKYADAAFAGWPTLTAIPALCLLILIVAVLAYTVSLIVLMSAYRKAFRKCLLEARKHAAA